MKHPNQQLNCPICGCTNINLFFEIYDMPIYCNVLWSTKTAALQAPKGDIRLGFCNHCRHIFNTAFNPELITYTPDYENSLHFSSRFQSYAESLAKYLIERYDLYDKDIIEIGCGKGDFLKLICRLGQNRGVGFDRSYKTEPRQQASEPHVTFVQDFFSEQAAHYPADLIICRHVLEHISTPADFLTMIRRAIGGRHHTALFFEVPNALFTLQDLGIWDIIYEHCAYFTRHSLKYLFHSYGFAVNKIDTTFAGQFLTIEATPNGGPAAKPSAAEEPIQSYVDAFSANYSNSLVAWRRKLYKFSRENQKVIIWGTGSKGVTFLNALPTRALIEFAVDINPRKQGKFVAGTGQKIVPPEFLQTYQPDIVVIMNPVYHDEIWQILTAMDINPEVLLAQNRCPAHDI